MNQIRSDLAVEICRHVTRNKFQGDGIEYTEATCGSMPLETIKVISPKGEELLGKPMGCYQTLNTGKLWLEDRSCFQEKVMGLRDLFLSVFRETVSKKSLILVVGLGNERITADAIGPVAVRNLIVTRHIRQEKPLIFQELGLSEVCALTPGVLGQTGMESADIVKSVTEHIKPDLVIAIDALASRDPERLVTTIQICDSGICPGAGIGNRRSALTPKTLNVPIISIGVPTVVDAATLASDAVFRFSGQKETAETIRNEWSKSKLNFFVTPKETDQIIRVMGSFIGYGINLALNEDMSFEDMLSLIG